MGQRNGFTPKGSTAYRASDHRVRGFACAPYLHASMGKPATHSAYHACVPPSDECTWRRNINLLPISYADYGLALGTG